MKAAVVIACCVLAPALAAFAGQGPATPEEGKPATEAAVALPFTVDKVWFRTAKFRLGLAWESKGELTVTESSLEYTHKKGTLRIARESIQSVSEGMLAPDVSNVWVIVRYAEDGRELVAAFSTPLFRVALQERLHAAIRAMMMMPPTAPAGTEERPAPTPELVAEESLKGQITLSIPRGWSAYDQTRLLTGEPAPLGTVVYSTLLFNPGQDPGAETVRRLNSGEIPSLTLERIPAPRGANCAAMTPATQERIVAMVENEVPMFDRGNTVVLAPRPEPLALNGVQGLRTGARSRDAAGVEWALDLAAFGDGTTLYLLYAYAPTDRFEESRQALAAVLPTVRLTRCAQR